MKWRSVSKILVCKKKRLLNKIESNIFYEIILRLLTPMRKLSEAVVDSAARISANIFLVNRVAYSGLTVSGEAACNLANKSGRWISSKPASDEWYVRLPNLQSINIIGYSMPTVKSSTSSHTVMTKSMEFIIWIEEFGWLQFRLPLPLSLTVASRNSAINGFSRSSSLRV